jgi:hypothetical protein
MIFFKFLILFNDILLLSWSAMRVIMRNNSQRQNIFSQVHFRDMRFAIGERYYHSAQLTKRGIHELTFSPFLGIRFKVWSLKKISVLYLKLFEIF